jgi:diguanylate cyclase (GGDEF)-like protein
MDSQRGKGSIWVFLETHEELYRVFEQPVWLGHVGQGSLQLYKPVNAATLRQLAIPDVQLQLRYASTVLADTRGTTRDEPAAPVNAWMPTLGVMPEATVSLKWPGSADSSGPEIVARRTLNSAAPFSEFILRPAVVIVFVSVILWLVLGRWLTLIVRRLESLTQAASVYIRDDDARSVEALVAPARDRHDEIHEMADTLTQLITSVETRNREHRTHVETLGLIEEAVLELDLEGHIVNASSAWAKLAHIHGPDPRTLFDFAHRDDADLLRAQCRLLASGEKHQISLRLRMGAVGVHDRWVECRFLGYHGPDGSVAGIRGVLRDITQTYLHEKQINHMALHDALTGLPNRVLLEDRLENALRLAARSGHKVGICFIDIDHFKNINDTLGHKIGDKLLLGFAERLRTTVRTTDTLARWGGDEFVLLMPEMESSADTRDVAQKLIEAVQAPLPIDEGELRITFSLGVAIFPDDGEDAETLFSQADRAMFYAKSQGRNQICFYHDMSSKGIGRKELYIQNRLAQAIKAGQIQAWYQPIIDAHSGACVSVEVLARWQDTEHGWVSPAVFVPMADNMGLIRELGQQVWLASLDGYSAWRAAGHRFRLAANISGRQLFLSAFTEQTLQELKRHRISPSDIVLEVTESVALHDVEHAGDRLRELKEAGFHLSIDDFGTGYSSLSLLQEIEVDELKIDISFVRRLNTPKGVGLVQSIADIAHTLGLKTVAEGVEDHDTAQSLRRLDIDLLQGYYFGQPMPRADLDLWLSQHQPQQVIG